MHPLTSLFLGFLLAGTAVKLWLGVRQLRAVQAGRARVPEPFDARVSLADHQKAADYTVAGDRLAMVETVVDAALLIAWTLGGGLALLDGGVTGLALPPLATGAIVILAALVAMSVLSLPFALYRTFVIEARFGFNRTTLRLFVMDQLKGLALILVLGAPLVLLVLWLMQVSGDVWWLYAGYAGLPRAPLGAAALALALAAAWGWSRAWRLAREDTA